MPMFEFKESVTLYVPDIQRSYEMVQESTHNSNKLIVEVAAIHHGLTANYNMYSPRELENALASWVQPYPKPIILNHDVYTDAVGRVMAARMDKESDGTDFVRLQAAITDPKAIEKILDERYLTGSVGGKADHALCSICGKDWVESSSPGLPCKHQRGKVYGGKLAYFELTGLSFREYSFVNVPADKRSTLLSKTSSIDMSASEDDNEWVRPLKFFSLDMDHESILEFSESEEPIEVLDKMRKKDAHFTYMNLKGTFLSSSAFDYKEEELETEKEEKFTFMQTYTTIDEESDSNMKNQTEENTEDANVNSDQEKEIMSEEVAQDEDILSVTEQLSADLAADVNDDSEESEESDEAVVDSEEEVSEGSEQASSTDEDEQDDSQESDVEQLTDEAIDTAEELATSDEESPEETEQAPDDHPLMAELLATSALIAEENAKLKEENERLKHRLHVFLAERVVDAKIALGLVEISTREEALEDHSSRSASSLADSLRDLEKYSRQNVKGSGKVVLDQKALGTSTESKNVIVLGEDDDVVPEDPDSPTDKTIDLLVDVLMGRKQL